MRAPWVSTLVGLIALAGCPAGQKPAESAPPPPQIVSFSADSARVQKGSSVTLTWETKDATSVELRQTNLGVISGANALSGSARVTVDAISLFVLVATNSRGLRDTVSIWVEVEGGSSRILFAANPGKIAAGETALLAWHAPGAARVELATREGTAVPLGGQLENGSVEVTPSLDTLYVLTVDGQTREVTVSVAPTVELLQATPSAAVPGAPLTVTWHTLGARKVTLSLVGVGELVSESDPGKVEDGSFDYQVPAVDPSAVLAFELLAEGSAPTLRTLPVYVAGAPKVRAWSAPSYAVIGKTFELRWRTSGADEVEILREGVPVYRSPTRELAMEGTVKLATPETDTSYQVRAIDLRGGVDLSNALIVSPVGVPTNLNSTFAASPLPGIAHGGEPVTLTWSVPGARNLAIVAKGQLPVTSAAGVSAESGSIQVYPNRDTVYELTADNGAGDALLPITAAVTVASPARLVFSPSTPVPEGTLVQLTGTTIPTATDLRPRNFALKNRPMDAFIDIAQTGTAIPFPAGADSIGVLVTLPAEFLTQWADVPQGGRKVSVSINGWMVFNDVAVQGDAVPKLKGTVAVFGHDLKADAGTRVFWQLDGVGAQQRLIVQWSDVRFFESAAKWVTAQVQLFASGDVVFAYQDVQGVDEWDIARVGVLPVASDTAWVTPQPSQLDHGLPATGDRLALFARLPLPWSLPATSEVMSISAALGNGRIVIDDAPELIP